MYDYLIVGAGLFGSTFARLVTDIGKSCLVIDKRKHIAGNCYTENIADINVHVYGPHIFHCNDDGIWEFVNKFTKFNNFRNSPLAFSGEKLFSLPFNMYTFNQMWGVTTPGDALEKIESQRLRLNRDPENLEEQALMLVGVDIYNTLIRDYTKKQWQKDPKELPASIIKRLPIRFTWDNNYFNDKYQGIPIGGYTNMFKNILKDIDVRTDVDYFSNKEYFDRLASKVVFTGKIDEFYGYRFGELEYRTLKFENQLLHTDNFQGNAVINYAEAKVPWTRIIEHKHFEPGIKSDSTYVTHEIPDKWSKDKTPYYPIGDEKNLGMWRMYDELASKEPGVIFGGRLAEYKYYDMHQVIGSAMGAFKREYIDKKM